MRDETGTGGYVHMSAFSHGSIIPSPKALSTLILDRYQQQVVSSFLPDPNPLNLG